MPRAQTVWKVVTFNGIGIVILGVAAVALSFSEMEPFESFGDDIFLPGLIGILIFCIGLIGWASQLGRTARRRMAALTVLPLPCIWIGGVLSHANIHDIFALCFIASIPLFLVGIILGIMALASR
jgi:hypothetical protein